ncbi:MAG: glycoside hydrolase family 127 protein [Ruminococcaceae bacterium]|nr:glycoside hydrolase family 127 protein [Oscillospiraceae bacterium]
MLKNISFEAVDLHDGFWKDKYDVNRKVSIGNVYHRFEETGRFDALRFNWKEKQQKIHKFYDSDVAKWIEAVSYLITKDKDGYVEEQKIIDDIVESMEKNQLPNGYLNSYFIQVEPENIFTLRDSHELYTMGHMIEAAIAYHEATGKRRLLDVMERCMECVENAFIIEKTAKFVTDRHEEIELALIKLYDHTGNKKYLDMCMHFLDMRGQGLEDAFGTRYNDLYSQSHIPVREQFDAVGHCVRAMYLYIGMNEAAQRSKDEKLRIACERLFDDVVKKRMYVTGGLGAAKQGECFTIPYDLPNIDAYSESCAAIGLALFAHSMQKNELDSKYADIVERVMYNNMLSAVSTDGKAFFYVNPLEIHLRSVGLDTAVNDEFKRWFPRRQRLEVFNVSCCPPNVNRIIAKIGGFFFSELDDSLIVNQFGALALDNGKIKLDMKTEYPADGKIRLVGKENTYKTLLIRRPWWCREYELKGAQVIGERNGYVEVAVGESFELELDLKMQPYFVKTHPMVRYDTGRIALCYGPSVYCMEGVDNAYELNAVSISVDADIKCERAEDCVELVVKGYVDDEFDGLYCFADKPKTEATLRFRPYRMFANRGETDMLIWTRMA